MISRNLPRTRAGLRCAPVALLLFSLGLAAGGTVRDVPPMPVDAAGLVTEGFIDAGAGVQLFYRMLGSGGETVVVIHGGPGFTMDYIAPDLAPLESGHTLILYDQRGTGRSSLVRDQASLDARRFGDDLEAVRMHFGLEKLTLLAHSWGAGVAAVYAARYPERLERLILVGAIPLRRELHVEAFERLERSRDSAERQRLQALREARLSDPGNPNACRAYYKVWFRPYFGVGDAADRSNGDFCAGAPEALANKVNSVDRFTMASLEEWDWRPALRAVNARSLVIHGTLDVLPIDGAEEWAAILPNARLLSLPGVGHFPYLEAPEPFFAAVEAFLQGRWPAGTGRSDR